MRACASASEEQACGQGSGTCGGHPAVDAHAGLPGWRASGGGHAQAVADRLGLRVVVLSTFEESPVIEIHPHGGATCDRILHLSFWAEASPCRLLLYPHCAVLPASAHQRLSARSSLQASAPGHRCTTTPYTASATSRPRRPRTSCLALGACTTCSPCKCVNASHHARSIIPPQRQRNALRALRFAVPGHSVPGAGSWHLLAAPAIMGQVGNLGVF